MKIETTRKCIVSGEIISRNLLLRFTLTPDGVVVPDFKKKLPGKGVYVCNKKTLLQKAIKKGLFSKALKVKVKADDTLVDIVENLLKKQALASLSLARKAGNLVCGFDKVSDVLKKNKVAFLIEAEDAGSDGHKKILTLAKDLEIFSLFKIEELDKELAKDSTVHLALIKGDMANMVRETMIRLTSFLNN